MKKTPFLLTLLASALLTACGGGGGGSSSGDNAGANDQNQGGQNSGDQGAGEQGSGNQGSETPEAAVLTFDARPLHYVAVKVADGAWQKVPAEEYSFTSTNPGGDLQVVVASACKERADFLSASVHVVNLKQDLALDLGSYCDADNSDSSVNIGDYDDVSISGISNYTSSGGNTAIYFDGDSLTADVAIANRSGSSLTLYTATDVRFVGGEDYSAEAGVELTDLRAFQGEVSYYVKDSNSGIFLNQNGDYASGMYHVVPDNMRLAGDFYEAEFAVSEYTYTENVNDISDVSIPDFSAYVIYEDQASSSDSAITLRVPNISELIPAGFSESIVRLESEISSEYILYEVDSSFFVDGELAISLVDFEALPGFPYEIKDDASEIKAELTKYWALSMTNDTKGNAVGFKEVTFYSRPRQ